MCSINGEYTALMVNEPQYLTSLGLRLRYGYTSLGTRINLPSVIQ